MINPIQYIRDRFSIRLFIKQTLSIMLFYVSFRFIGNSKLRRRLKNSYSGRRMFIICNGPSLSPSDLDKLAQNGELSMASNGIDGIFERTEWCPTFYTVMDEGAQYVYLERMNRIPSKYQFYRRNSYITTRKTRYPSVFFRTDGSKRLLDNPRFSSDCDKVIYTIGTITYAMIQLSVYLGCRDIYIIGCDNSYPYQRLRDGSIVKTNAGAGYFEGKNTSTLGMGASMVWRMDIAYNAARKYADANGVHIYNATRGGELEAFERVEFDSLFN